MSRSRSRAPRRATAPVQIPGPMPGETRQQLEFGRRQVDRGAVALHPHLRPVDRQIGDGEHRPAVGFVSGAPQNGGNPGGKLAGTEGFGDVVVRADFEAAQPVTLVDAGCQHDDRHVRLAPERPGDLEAVEPRQPEIEDDEIRPLLAPSRARLSVGRDRRPESRRASGSPAQRSQSDLVVDDQHEGHVRALSSYVIGPAIRRRRVRRSGVRGACDCAPGGAIPPFGTLVLVVVRVR